MYTHSNNQKIGGHLYFLLLVPPPSFQHSDKKARGFSSVAFCRPEEMQVCFQASTVSFLSSGALPDPQGEQETGKKKRVPKVKGGAIERIPRELKHLDTSSEVSKHGFPQDRWERHPGCWVRVQSRPHKSLFIPTGTKDGPNINDLDRVRVTDIRFSDDDKTETVHDQ